MKKKASSAKENQSRGSQKPVKKTVATLKAKVPANATTATKITVRPKTGEQDIIALILRDHIPLKELIETLKDGELDRADKEEAYQRFAPLLMSHAKAEEKTLYVQMREDKKLRVESFEGDTEHAIADQLMQEINATPDDDEWNAKVKVLAESVEHHIGEEEEDMLPDVEKAFSIELRNELAAEYTLLKSGIDSVMNPMPSHISSKQQSRLS